MDWDHWVKFRTVSLGEAVCLAQDIEPESVGVHDYDISPFEPLLNNPILAVPDLKRPYDAALSAIASGDGLSTRKKYKSQIPEAMPCVDIAEFGAWMNKMGYWLPEEFPISRVEQKCQEAVSLELPYEVKLLTGIAEIMFDNYASLGKGETPNQKKVALEIDEMMDWKNQKKGETASRVAVSIAAAIQPLKFQKKLH